MLKILIVDDDILTRQGIRTLMPWQKHQMEIIGEAANGKEALAFLKCRHVDLALVDLDMPIMNGTAFIREAKTLYPDLQYVVLTVHTEFSYVQEALRLGAIDYIAKTQFDQENFDQILERIRTGIARKALQPQLSKDWNWRSRRIPYSQLYALITLEAESDEHIRLFLDLNGLSDHTEIHELLPGCWVFFSDLYEFAFPDAFPFTILLCISDTRGMPYEKLARLLRHYKTEQFFYDCQPVHAVIHKHAGELQEEKYVTDEKTLDRLKDEWSSLNWVYENALFDRFTFDLKNCRLKSSRLYHLLLSLENIWNTSYGKLLGKSASLPPAFHCWSEVEDWLSGLYETANMCSGISRYAPDVIQNILSAKLYVNTHLSSMADTAEIARSAHMSYSYFSRCFRDIIGMPFNEYCTNLRMEKAQEYLLHTSLPIQQIAHDVGYGDEKYFSRIFKKQTGLSPSEFRKQKLKQ